jgi:hypothetical protein
MPRDPLPTSRPMTRAFDVGRTLRAPWVACWVLAVAALCGTAPAAAEERLRVAVIAVTEFDNGTLKDELLVDSIRTARDQLVRFFEKHYQLTPTVFKTRDETTGDSLRRWLFGDLASDTSPAVHLVFVLTHGFVAPGNRNQKQIFLATSDTDPGSYAGTAVRGDEFLSAFKLMPNRSVVFLFLDACGAGAIDGDGLQRDLRYDPELAARIMILAASQADQLAYRARLIRSLVGIWESPTPGCHHGRADIERFLTRSLLSIPGVAPDVTQTVRLVAPLAPEFCIEAFNYSQRVGFVFNGSERDVRLTLDDGSGVEQDPIDLRPRELVTLLLRPRRYSLVAQTLGNGDGEVGGTEVSTMDLSDQPVAQHVFFSKDPVDAVATMVNAAGVLASRKAFPAEAEKRRTEAETQVQALERAAKDGAIKTAARQREIEASLEADQRRIAVAEEEIAAARARRAAVVAWTHEHVEGCATCMTTLPVEKIAELQESSAAEDKARQRSDEARSRADSLSAEASRLAREQLAEKAHVQQRDRVRAALSVWPAQVSALAGVVDALKERFSVESSSRGVAVVLPHGEELNAERVSPDYGRLVRVAKERGLRIELELLTRFGQPLSVQEKLRVQMRAFVAALQRDNSGVRMVGRIQYDQTGPDPKLVAFLSAESNAGR